MINCALLYINSLTSTVSRREMKLKLNAVAWFFNSNIDEFEWHELTPFKVQETLVLLEDKGLAYSSVNAYLSALKGVAKEAWRNNLMDGDTFAKIKDISNRKGSRLPVGKALNKPQIDELFKHCSCDQSEIRGKRNAAILAIALFMGLRRSEIGSLKISNLDFQNEVIRVVGKGNKEREVPVASKVMQILNDWIKIRNDDAERLKIKGDYLFGSLSRDKGSSLRELKGLTGESIRLIIKEISIGAGVDFDGASPTPHDMRRTAITAWLDEAGDPRVAQKLAGHSQIQTTMVYSRSNLDEQIRKVVEKTSKTD